MINQSIAADDMPYVSLKEMNCRHISPYCNSSQASAEHFILRRVQNEKQNTGVILMNQHTSLACFKNIYQLDVILNLFGTFAYHVGTT